MKRSLLVALAGVLGLTGCPCVGSLYPMYADDELAIDPGLEGRWRFVEADSEQPPDPEGRDIVVIRTMNKAPETVLWFDIPPNLPGSLYVPRDLPTYCIEPYKRRQGQEQAKKEEGIAESGQEPSADEMSHEDGEDYTIQFRLVDLKDRRFADIIWEPENGLAAPTHWFARLRERETGLEVDLLDFTWLVDYIEKKPHALKYETLPLGRGRDAYLLITSKPKALQRFLHKHFDTPEAWMPLGRFERVTSEESEAK